jgi:hypothetical protein
MLKFFDAGPDPESFRPRSRIRDGKKFGSGIRDKHPRSGALPSPLAILGGCGAGGDRIAKARAERSLDVSHVHILYRVRTIN